MNPFSTNNANVNIVFVLPKQSYASMDDHQGNVISDYSHNEVIYEWHEIVILPIYTFADYHSGSWKKIPDHNDVEIVEVVWAGYRIKCYVRNLLVRIHSDVFGLTFDVPMRLFIAAVEALRASSPQYNVIQTIKSIRAVQPYSLREAKTIVDGIIENGINK